MKVSDYILPNSSEIIEALSRKLERARILAALKECHTLEDYQKLTRTYEILCDEDKKSDHK